MAKDSKSVAERAQDLREFANTVSSISDEKLEEVVGGCGGAWDGDMSTWLQQFNDYLDFPTQGQGS